MKFLRKDLSNLNDVPCFVWSSFFDYTALGASAVGIGKPIFFALGVGGEEAVSHLLSLLQTEFEAAMAICGIERVEDIRSSHVTRHPYPTLHRSNL